MVGEKKRKRGREGHSRKANGTKKKRSEKERKRKTGGLWRKLLESKPVISLGRIPPKYSSRSKPLNLAGSRPEEIPGSAAHRES